MKWWELGLRCMVPTGHIIAGFLFRILDIFKFSQFLDRKGPRWLGDNGR